MRLNDFEQPSVTVDLVLFTIKNRQLQVLLIKRKIDPYKGKWAFPGGFVRIDESLEHAVIRELEEETGVKDVYCEQLYSFGDPKRDPRGRVITIAYFALVNASNLKIKASTDAAEVKWFNVLDVKSLAFDHNKILDYALKRLKWKFEYTTIAFSLLPKSFSLGDLQRIYEIVFQKELDKRNFRKKVLSLEILKEESIREDVPYRHPQLYSLNAKIGQIVDMI